MVSLHRCVVRYGYKDIHKDDHKFEDRLIQNLGDFILTEDEVENNEAFNGEDGSDGPLEFSGIRSSSMVHAVNSDGVLLERSTKGKEPLGISQVPPSICLLFSVMECSSSSVFDND